MKAKIKTILKTLLFFTLGIVLFYIVYKDTDFREVFYELRHINYSWLILFSALLILSNVSRAVRWQMLIKSYGGNSGFLNTFFAVLIGYFANIAVPRLGEVSKCAIISKYEKQPLSKVLGTMVSERVFDILMVIILSIAVVLLQSEVVVNFFDTNPEFKKNIEKLLTTEFIVFFIAITVFSIFMIIYIIKGHLNKFLVFKRASDFIKSFWNGLIGIKNIKNKGLFIFHSLFIWTLYFLMIYVAFPAFEGFSDLGLLAALTVYVAAAYGMIAPTPGGIGAYHFMISQTLVLYAIGHEKALIFALVIHGVQTIVIAVSGIIALALLPIINKPDAQKKLD